MILEAASPDGDHTIEGGVEEGGTENTERGRIYALHDLHKTV